MARAAGRPVLRPRRLDDAAQLLRRDAAAAVARARAQGRSPRSIRTTLLFITAGFAARRGPTRPPRRGSPIRALARPRRAASSRGSDCARRRRLAAARVALAAVHDQRDRRRRRRARGLADREHLGALRCGRRLGREPASCSTTAWPGSTPIRRTPTASRPASVRPTRSRRALVTRDGRLVMTLGTPGHGRPDLHARAILRARARLRRRARRGRRRAALVGRFRRASWSSRTRWIDALRDAVLRGHPRRARRCPPAGSVSVRSSSSPNIHDGLLGLADYRRAATTAGW